MPSVLTGCPMRRLPIAALVALAACAPPDFPEDRVFADSGARTIPAIAPVADILSAAEPGDADPTAADLQARGAQLRDRADALRRATP